jgi:hypothetical protein
MRWCTTGPGGLSYGFGDVFAVALPVGRGHLAVRPRITATPADDGPAEPVFLADLQQRIEAAGLPWTHVPVDRDGWIRIGCDITPGSMLVGYAEILASHSDSLQAVLGASSAVTGLTLRVDCRWTLPAADIPHLLSWIAGERVPGPLTPQDLAAGRIGADGWYEPPSALAEAFEHMGLLDRPRDLATRAVAHAVLAGHNGDLWLHQPGDDLEMTIALDGPDGPADDVQRAVVFFRPVEHPVLDLLAGAFGVGAADRHCVFYSCTPGENVLPAEEPRTAEEVGHGIAYIRLVSRAVLNRLADDELPHGGHRIFHPREEGEEMQIHHTGWHAGGGEAEVVAAFADSGLRLLPLPELLRRERIETGGTWQERLGALLGSDATTAMSARFLLGETDATPAELTLWALQRLVVALDGLAAEELDTARLATLWSAFVARSQRSDLPGLR